MSLKLVSLFLVIAGGVLLAMALRPTKLIRDEKRQVAGWYALFLLIVFFIAGYLVYVLVLISRPVDYPEFMVSLVFFGGGVFVLVMMRVSSFTLMEIKRIAALERHHASHDDLTDLPNRHLFRERLDRLISNASNHDRGIAVLLIDLNRLGEINDTLGHHCGDQMLKLVAERVKGLIREGDSFARLGGEEFVLALPGTDREGALVLSRTIIQAIEHPFLVEGHNLDIGACIGISLYPEHGVSSNTLLQYANAALSVIGNSGSGCSVYDPELDRNSLDRLTMAGALRGAIRNCELLLYYQPKLDIKSGAVIAVEALARWNRPGFGLVQPSEFIPLAERTGMISLLTNWVLNAALRQAAVWHKDGVDVDMAVNISTKNLVDEDFVGMVGNTLKAWDVAPSRLILEVTESSIMADPERAYTVISQLHGMGVRLSIDDFGTGYSSLAYIKRLPAVEIKIDKSFVQNMAEDENDAVIVRSTIDLAHNMGRKVIAEGIESREIYDLLEILGCDMAQGYHVCHPLPPEEFQSWLAAFLQKNSQP